MGKSDSPKSIRSITSKSSSKVLIAAANDRRDVPAVGCITEVADEHLSKYPILPPYVLLFEPSEEEIWIKPGQQRTIFLNQPLMDWEQDAVVRFVELIRKELTLPPSEELPRWLLPHLTRLLQQCKYKPEQAVKLYRHLLVHRVERLPMEFNDVKEILEHGLVYWHGRDVCCRPLLTIRAGRVGPLISRTDEISRAFIFTMEYAVRYLLVPGRVEGWSVIIDCEGINKLPSFLKCKGFATAIATTLGKVYSGRMAWTKILNFPTGFAYTALKKLVQGIVSALGKSEKVQFASSGGTAAAMSGHVELGQLETWAGGTAPDLQPNEVFPPRMFADPKGYGASSEGSDSLLYRRTGLKFHEGFIWADCLDEQTHWRERAAALPLPPGAAEAAGIKPCSQLEAWRDIMDKWNSTDSTSPEDCGHGQAALQAVLSSSLQPAAADIKVNGSAGLGPRSAAEADMKANGSAQEKRPDHPTHQTSLPAPLTLPTKVLEDELPVPQCPSRLHNEVEDKTPNDRRCTIFCCSS